jgi:hypothetical protein
VVYLSAELKAQKAEILIDQIFILDKKQVL